MRKAISFFSYFRWTHFSTCTEFTVRKFILPSWGENFLLFLFSLIHIFSVSASVACAGCCSISGKAPCPPPKPQYFSPPLLSGDYNFSWKFKSSQNSYLLSAVAVCDSILYKEALKTIAPSLTQKLSEATKLSARRLLLNWLIVQRTKYYYPGLLMSFPILSATASILTQICSGK